MAYTWKGIGPEVSVLKETDEYVVVKVYRNTWTGSKTQKGNLVLCRGMLYGQDGTAIGITAVQMADNNDTRNKKTKTDNRTTTSNKPKTEASKNDTKSTKTKTPTSNNKTTNTTKSELAELLNTLRKELRNDIRKMVRAELGAEDDDE